MTQSTTQITVAGPWSLATSKQFWESFAPTELTSSSADAPLQTTFCVEGDWQRAEATVSQHGSIAHIEVRGDGDLDAATAQCVASCHWTSMRVPGHRSAPATPSSPMLKGGYLAFDPAGFTLRTKRLPGRKTEHLHAVADAALDGALDGATLRAMDPDDAVEAVRQVKGLGPSLPSSSWSAVPTHPMHCHATSADSNRKSPSATARQPLSRQLLTRGRPFRSWAAVHRRVLREERTHEIGESG